MGTTDEVPDVPQYWKVRTDGRARTGPAWEAAWEMLADGKAYPRAEIIAVMREANPISVRTAKELLIRAVDDGTLEVVARDRYTRPTLKRSM